MAKHNVRRVKAASDWRSAKFSRSTKAVLMLSRVPAAPLSACLRQAGGRWALQRGLPRGWRAQPQAMGDVGQLAPTILLDDLRIQQVGYDLPDRPPLRLDLPTPPVCRQRHEVIHQTVAAEREHTARRKWARDWKLAQKP